MVSTTLSAPPARLAPLVARLAVRHSYAADGVKWAPAIDPDAPEGQERP